MEPKTFDEAAKQVALDIASIVTRKQHDYGQGNILAFGEYGVLVRVNDKVERLKNLHRKGTPPMNEAALDSWFDVAGYGIIAVMLQRGWFTLPLEGE